MGYSKNSDEACGKVLPKSPWNRLNTLGIAFTIPAETKTYPSNLLFIKLMEEIRFNNGHHCAKFLLCLFFRVVP